MDNISKFETVENVDLDKHDENLTFKPKFFT